MIAIDKFFGLKVGIGVMVIFLILYFVFFPWCVAWALNYLFNQNIAYTFDTWVAVTILHGFIHGVVKSK